MGQSEEEEEKEMAVGTLVGGWVDGNRRLSSLRLTLLFYFFHTIESGWKDK